MCSMFGVSATIQVPSFSFWLLRTWIGTLYFLANSTARVCSTDCAQAGQFQHLIVADPVDLAGVFHDARVGGEDAIDIGVIFADIRLQHRADGHQRRIAPAAAQGGVIAFGRHALKPGDDDDLSRCQAARKSAAC